MNNVQGMTLKQFNDVLEEMKQIYPFREDQTYLGNLHDLPSNSMRVVEIITEDYDSHIQIIMRKEVEREF